MEEATCGTEELEQVENEGFIAAFSGIEGIDEQSEGLAIGRMHLTSSANRSMEDERTD